MEQSYRGMTLFEILLANLKQTIPYDALDYLSIERTCEILKRRTGADFGYNVEQWRHYLRQNFTRYGKPKAHLLENLVVILENEDESQQQNREQAYNQLKTLTRQDFGYESQKWRIWLERDLNQTQQKRRKGTKS
jgi:hypothetical protein